MPIAIKRRAVLAASLWPTRAMAQRPVIRIGVLTALSGTYADASGLGAVVATKLAIEDFRAQGEPGFDIEVLEADMQDKPEVGVTVAGAWFDRDGVDVISDVPNSAIALAVASLVRARNKVALFGGPGAAAISGAQCSPNHIQWTWDTYAVASGTARAVLAEGGKSWFFITADYVFGHALEADARRVIEAGGGTVVGSVAFPYLETADFSAYLEQARASGATVIGLACTASSLNNLVKQAGEFGIARQGGTRLAGLLILIHNVHAIGLADAQGLFLTEPFYWDLNDGTRAFARRFAPLHRGMMPSMTQAGAYAGALHYLKAVKALGVEKAKADGAAVVAKMKQIPGQDPLFGDSVVRRNGSVAHDMHLFQVKAPSESAYPWDYYRLVRSIPASQAFRDVGESGCGL